MTDANSRNIPEKRQRGLSPALDKEMRPQGREEVWVCPKRSLELGLRLPDVCPALTCHLPSLTKGQTVTFEDGTHYRHRRMAARGEGQGLNPSSPGISHVTLRRRLSLWGASVSSSINGCNYIIHFPGGAVVKNPSANAGDTGEVGLIPGLGRSPGGGNGNPLQCSCLENLMDRKAWGATVHGVARS